MWRRWIRVQTRIEIVGCSGFEISRTSPVLSALDSATEKSIQAELRDIARDRTTLVIAHRLSTIIDVNQILVMNHGRIVERGNFRKLIEQNRKFA